MPAKYRTLRTFGTNGTMLTEVYECAARRAAHSSRDSRDVLGWWTEVAHLMRNTAHKRHPAGILVPAPFVLQSGKSLSPVRKTPYVPDEAASGRAMMLFVVGRRSDQRGCIYLFRRARQVDGVRERNGRPLDALFFRSYSNAFTAAEDPVRLKSIWERR